jgi:hypothetical protein
VETADIASVIAMLLAHNLETLPTRVVLARKFKRPIAICGKDIDSTCTINCGPRAVSVFNDVVGKPTVTVRATVDQTFASPN